MDKNLIFIEYQAKVSFVTDNYLNKYLQKTTKENRTVDTAKEFLSTYSDKFREEIASIGVNMIHNHGLTKEVEEVVLGNNSWAISKLFVEVMNTSTDNPIFDTKI